MYVLYRVSSAHWQHSHFSLLQVIIMDSEKLSRSETAEQWEARLAEQREQYRARTAEEWATE